jgi:hypothetical protein
MVLVIGARVYPGKQSAAIAALKINIINFKSRKGD